MIVKARFWVQEVTKIAAQGGSVVRKVSLSAVTRGTDDNQDWAKYTPSGQITMHVNADEAGEWFENNIAKDMIVTFDVIE